MSVVKLIIKEPKKVLVMKIVDKKQTLHVINNNQLLGKKKILSDLRIPICSSIGVNYKEVSCYYGDTLCIDADKVFIERKDNMIYIYKYEEPCYKEVKKNNK